MKNYLVKSLFKIKDPDWKILDRSYEKNMYENYIEMHRLSVASYKKYLKGDWELKFITGNCDHINQAFENTFWAIHDLWHKEPCNILYTDPDTVAIKDVDLWDQYDRFMMFNHTDPKSLTTNNIYNKQFDNFFNAGVRYFPSTMTADTWKLGTAIAKNWDYTTYNTEQIILNDMLWNQGIGLKEIIDPTMAYQVLTLDEAQSDIWNNSKLSQAKILHFHSSRDSFSRREIMKQISQAHGTIC